MTIDEAVAVLERVDAQLVLTFPLIEGMDEKLWEALKIVAKEYLKYNKRGLLPRIHPLIRMDPIKRITIPTQDSPRPPVVYPGHDGHESS